MKTPPTARRLLAAIVGTLASLPVGATLRADPPPALTVGAGAEALARADNDFCRLAGVEGAAKAFDVYMAADSINPSPDATTPPGKRETVETMRKLDASGQVLTWHPLRAEIAASGDFGYTYGPWEMHKKDGGALTAKGYYVTVWKKTDGKWKAAFDMGNEATLEAK